MEAHDLELGPIDILVIAYPAGAPMTGEAVPLMMDLVDRGIIRVLDAMFVIKNEDGTVSGFEATDLDDKGVGDLRSSRGRPPACSAMRMLRQPRTPSSPGARP